MSSLTGGSLGGRSRHISTSGEMLSVELALVRLGGWGDPGDVMSRDSEAGVERRDCRCG